MLLRLLLLGLVIAVAVAWLRRRRNAGAAPRAIAASTLRCAHCAVYFPSTDAVRRDGVDYCSTAHAEAGTRPR